MEGGVGEEYIDNSGTNMEKNKKIISASILTESLFEKNPRAEVKVHTCEISDQCSLYKNRQCINLHMVRSCIYGGKYREIGPTKKSRKFGTWVSEKREQYKDVLNYLQSTPPDKMTVVGEYIWLPYSFIEMNQNVPLAGHSSFLLSGIPLIKTADFSLENIKSIVTFRPHALIGGEISEYQKEEVPKFLIHLYEIFPKLYVDLFEKYPELNQYKVKKISYVGRTALLKTLKHGVKITVDSKSNWTWDGEKLISDDFKPLFLNMKDANGMESINSIQTVITPKDNMVVKITSDEQVLPTTVYIN